MPFRAVLFDHDGTLVDSEPVHHRLWNGVLAAYGVVIPGDLYQRRYAGVPCLALPTPMSRHHDFSQALAVLDGMPAAVVHLRRALGA